MPFHNKDDQTAQLVAELARLRGLTKQAAAKMAVKAERDCAAETITLRDRFAALRTANPLPSPTGAVADKRFFDDLSGEP